MTTAISDSTKLSIVDRIELIGDIWDSIVAEEKPIALSDERRAELRRRREAHKAESGDAIPREEIRRTHRRV